MSDPLERLRRNYTPAFLAHLARHSETGLRSAYELGRSAMVDQISALDLVQIHHAAFLDVALTIKDLDELPDLVNAAATFLVEALAPFEMTRHTPVRPATD